MGVARSNRVSLKKRKTYRFTISFFYFKSTYILQTNDSKQSERSAKKPAVRSVLAYKAVQEVCNAVVELVETTIFKTVSSVQSFSGNQPLFTLFSCSNNSFIAHNDEVPVIAKRIEIRPK